MSQQASQTSPRSMRHYQVIVLGLCIVAATVTGSFIFARGFMSVTRFMKETITVTGSAQRRVTSDRAEWYGSFERQGPSIEEVYRSLKADCDKVRNYMVAAGFPEKDLTLSPVRTETLFFTDADGHRTNTVEGYRLSQTVGLVSNEVFRVRVVSRDSTELILQGVQFESRSPDFYCTKIDDLKVDMLALAAQNAKSRAENMVLSTGSRIGPVRSARMGVFQITPADSTEVSDEGINDTSSIEKKVTAVVSVTFAIE